MTQVINIFLVEFSNYFVLHSYIIEYINTNENTNSNETNRFQNYLKYTISTSILECNRKHSIEYPNVDNGFPIT